MKKIISSTIFTTFVYLFFVTNPVHANNFVKITEIFPNPEGRDNGKEWVEISNESTKTVNLQGWTITTGSKKIKLKNIQIKPNSYISTPIQLKNSNNTVKLINKQGEIVNSIQYDEAKEGLSYSDTSTKWLWTTPTKAKPNKKIIKIKGTVTKEPQVGRDFFVYINQKKVIFDEKDFQFQFMKTFLKEGTEIEALIIEENMKIKEFKVLKEATQKGKKENPSKRIYLIPPIISLLFSLIVLIKHAPA